MRTTSCTTVRNSLLLALFLVCYCISDLSASESRCSVVSITGQSVVNPNTGAFEGQGVLTMDGESIRVEWVSIVLGVLSADADNTQHLIGSHDFKSVNSSHEVDFTTFDQLTLIPTSEPGVFTAINHLEISVGRGQFGRGQLVAGEGKADLINGTVEIVASLGKFCRRADDD